MKILCLQYALVIIVTFMFASLYSVAGQGVIFRLSECSQLFISERIAFKFECFDYLAFLYSSPQKSDFSYHCQDLFDQFILIVISAESSDYYHIVNTGFRWLNVFQVLKVLAYIVWLNFMSICKENLGCYSLWANVWNGDSNIFSFSPTYGWHLNSCLQCQLLLLIKSREYQLAAVQINDVRHKALPTWNLYIFTPTATNMGRCDSERCHKSSHAWSGWVSFYGVKKQSTDISTSTKLFPTSYWV